VLNFWPYVARLEATGMQRLIGIQEVASTLGITSEVPFVGYVFDEQWAAANRQAALGFIHATIKAKKILQHSDQEWLRLRPLMKASNDATFNALRDGFRAGIPRHWGEQEQHDADRLFDILYKLGGKQLVGNTTRVTEGTFWPDVSY
jgi:NitT/TauT family transport system substrate-binding protein